MLLYEDCAKSTRPREYPLSSPSKPDNSVLFDDKWETMPMLHLLVLAILYSGAYGGYVQSRSCDGQVNNGGLGSSLYVQLQQAHDSLEHDTLSLTVSPKSVQQCRNDSISSDFSATLHLDMLGRHSVYSAINTSVCRTAPLEHVSQALVYPLTFQVASLPPLSTFSIRLQLESETDQVQECLHAELTPALGEATSTALAWMPRTILPFVLIVGLLRYRDERARGYMHAPSTSNLRLPGLGDCLSYMQWIFLSAGLSLHYPGFLQPIASKFNLFSLFLTGPVTHGRVYSGVADGIYSINGTYGGTTGLEHMHQIVGAPSTIDTWVNMVIAVLIISVSTALLLEAVTVGKRASNREVTPSSQDSLSARLVSRITAILRVVLSYFTMPLSALSFYQLSASRLLPVWHTVSAALLVLSIMLALIWLLYRLPSRTIGLLMHETPKWYQEQGKQIHQAEKIYVTVLVTLTFIRGAIIGGLQALGPVQLSLLAASELCLLLTIRWLQVHPWLSMSTMAPAVRLATTLMMICFVRGLTDDSARTAVGYAIVTLHAFTLVVGVFLPAAYHLVKITCRAAKRIMYRVSPLTCRMPMGREEHFANLMHRPPSSTSCMDPINSQTPRYFIPSPSWSRRMGLETLHQSHARIITALRSQTKQSQQSAAHHLPSVPPPNISASHATASHELMREGRRLHSRLARRLTNHSHPQPASSQKPLQRSRDPL
jgi:hypothetical protein